MDADDSKASASRNRFHPRWTDSAWLYDPVTEDFQAAKPARARPAPQPRRPASPKPVQRLGGRIVDSLFAKGWMCPLVFILIIVFSIVGSLVHRH